MRKTIRVKTEAWCERVRLRGGTNLAVAFCDGCGKAVRFVTPEMAAGMLHANTREVYRGIEVGDLHYLEVDKIALLVCVNSLEEKLANRANADRNP
ncbi:MAG: hypothetical protein HY231_00570 [Acidobacteria bacterium]|nr:hypothetical protein [Acidobacteriota bacterium]